MIISEVWGVESICAVLTQHEVPIAPSSYYHVRKRLPSARHSSDERWAPIVSACSTDDDGATRAALTPAVRIRHLAGLSAL